MSVFSERLIQIRKSRGISQSALAKEIGVSAGNISDWETGRSKPGYAALKELSCFLNVSADYLLELTETPVKTGNLVGSTLLCDNVPLSQMESDVIAMLRLLNEHDRKNAVDFITMLYEQTTGEKGSVYSTYIEDENEQTKRAVPLKNSRDGIA